MLGQTVNDHDRSIILRLFEIGAVKFGTFTLKSGIQSPFYIDLRLTVSFPSLLRDVASSLTSAAATASHDVLCGVPYTALPFATAMSLDTGRPMLMRRKEAKQHGTKKVIEGDVHTGQTCLIVEDLVTSGLSVLETVTPLRDAGLRVTDVVVLLDREQNARRNLTANGITLHAVFAMSTLLDVLVSAGKLTTAVQDSVLRFISDNQLQAAATGKITTIAPATPPRKRLSTYDQRAPLVRNNIGRRLLQLMAHKRTNLAVAADVTSTDDLLALAEAVGPHICMLKTHADIISDWRPDTAVQLKALATRHNFLIFEDRKFADIGNTVHRQLCGGVHAIASWANIINAHSVPGPGIVAGLSKAKDEGHELGIVLLAEMSSEGNLASALPDYKVKTVEMAQQHTDAVFGFISMDAVAGEEFVYMTPGVNMSVKGDALGQQYASPERVIGERCSDVIIVGRGIYKAEDKEAAAQQYRQAGWEAYERRCNAS